MKRLLLLASLSLLVASGSHAQDAAKDTSYWSNNMVLYLNFNLTGFNAYWQAGGVQTTAFGARFIGSFDYQKAKWIWDNDVDLAYGTVQQGKRADWIKGEDQILVTSKVGYQIQKAWYLSLLGSFRSQFDKGYEFNPEFPTKLDSATLISSLLSPGYVNLGLGVDYKPNDKLSINISPANAKLTIVTDESLRAKYIPPAITTNAVRAEIGANLRIKYANEVFKNVHFTTEANFFANYLDKFGNVDVNWTTLTLFEINKWLATSLSTNLIYDDDIAFQDFNDAGELTAEGPRTQFNYVFALGITLTFLKSKEAAE